MKNILISGAVILGIAAVVAGGTGAFFSDTETASGNTFAAGVIDLKVDNESYYNGNKCALDVNDLNENKSITDYTWQGPAAYPVPGTTCTTSWDLTDLAQGHLFFDFRDVKPDDEGEDTISLHVDTNDAWACMDITLTSNDDVSSNEPELLTGDDENDAGLWDGELAAALSFVWWADDGDNVLESDENIFIGNESVGDTLDTMTNGGSSTLQIALADSANNVWDGESGEPIPGDSTVYIAKAWCLGEIGPDPVDQDGDGKTGTNGPQQRGTGISCNGIDLGNELQTDSATLDIQFRTMQARHNPSFECANDAETTITIIKQVIGDNPPNVAGDFQMLLDGDEVPQNEPIPVSPGSYTVTETGPLANYFTAFEGACAPDGEITVAEGEDAVCTVINRYAPACQLVEAYADEVIDVDQGKRKNGTLVLPERSIHSSVLGAPQSSGLPSDPAVAVGSFLSLGFATSSFGTSSGEASIVLSFNDNFVVNGPGLDLKLWEVTGGVYPDELVTVQVSNDLVTWTTVATGVTRDAEIELGSVLQARYVKIINTSPAASFPDATADGYDLDAVQALNCVTRPTITNEID